MQAASCSAVHGTAAKPHYAYSKAFWFKRRKRLQSSVFLSREERQRRSKGTERKRQHRTTSHRFQHLHVDGVHRCDGEGRRGGIRGGRGGERGWRGQRTRESWKKKRYHNPLHPTTAPRRTCSAKSHDFGKPVCIVYSLQCVCGLYSHNLPCKTLKTQCTRGENRRYCMQRQN